MLEYQYINLSYLIPFPISLSLVSWMVGYDTPIKQLLTTIWKFAWLPFNNERIFHLLKRLQSLKIKWEGQAFKVWHQELVRYAALRASEKAPTLFSPMHAPGNLNIYIYNMNAFLYLVDIKGNFVNCHFWHESELFTHISLYKLTLFYTKIEIE